MEYSIWRDSFTKGSDLKERITDPLLISLYEKQKAFSQFALNAENHKWIDDVTTLIYDTIHRGNKVFICGNGGSLCQAMHFAEECTGRFRKDRRPLPVVALADASHITCVANDYGFDEVFARPIQALGKPDDLLIVLSTSGNSPNIIQAITRANKQQMKVIGLLGRDGGNAKEGCDFYLIAPGETSDTIQEIHQVVLHLVVGGIERKMGLDE